MPRPLHRAAPHAGACACQCTLLCSLPPASSPSPRCTTPCARWATRCRRRSATPPPALRSSALPAAATCRVRPAAAACRAPAAALHQRCPLQQRPSGGHLKRWGVSQGGLSRCGRQQVRAVAACVLTCFQAALCEEHGSAQPFFKPCHSSSASLKRRLTTSRPMSPTQSCCLLPRQRAWYGSASECSVQAELSYG